MRLSRRLRPVLVTFTCALVLGAASSPPQRAVSEPTSGAGWLELRQRERLLQEKQWAEELRDRKTADAIDAILKDPLKWQQARADLLATLTGRQTSLKELNLPTRYEDPIAYTILKRATAVVQAGNVPKFFNVNPLYGTSTGGTFHALTKLVCPSSDYVILFHRQLFSLARFFTTMFLAADGRSIVLRPDLIALVQNGLLAYLLEGDIDNVQVPILTDDAQRRAGFMLTVIEGFVVAHEHAHITGRHFTPCGVNANRAVGADLRYEQSQEYSADGLAFTQMLEWAAEKQLNPVNVFLAVDWQFAVLELLERAGAVLTTGSEEPVPDSPWSDTTHPYIRYRRAYLLTLASKLLPKEADALNNASRIASDLRYEMWKASMFKVLEQRQNTRVISPSVRR